jgi:hypothetical protein
MGALMKIVGERAMNPYLEPLEDLRKVKVKEAFEKAVVKCKVGAAAPPPRVTAPSKPEPPKVSIVHRFIWSHHLPISAEKSSSKAQTWRRVAW